MAANDHKQVQLPIYRVRTIMKSSPEVENISNESIHLVAKATELFVQYLAQESLLCSESSRELQYKDIALIVDRDQRFEFLRGVYWQEKSCSYSSKLATTSLLINTTENNS